ncbi:MAG: hypothetical protein Q8P18_28185 [Pseudomonadota bacterium]|nr:hypothetical protein [Pseudomonadota bacterium]
MSTALSKAVAGEKVPDSKKTGVLNEALDKVKSLGGRLSRAKEMSESIADAVIATAETQGTVFAASFAEGYLGEEKMDLGPVDLRLGGGLIVGGYGLYQSMSGKGGSHALAIGNGLLATGIGRIGRHAGKALADKKNAPATPPAQAPAPAPAAAPAPAPAQLKGDDIGEIARMVRMSPGTEGEAVEGRRRREGGRSERFIRERR